MTIKPRHAARTQETRRPPAGAAPLRFSLRRAAEHQGVRPLLAFSMKAIGLVALFLSLTANGRASQCVPDPRTDKEVVDSLPDGTNVFAGTVLTEAKGLTTIGVTHCWFGSKREVAYIKTAMLSFTFEPGKTYLIFAVPISSEKESFFVSLCSKTRVLTDADRLLGFLGPANCLSPVKAPAKAVHKKK